MSSSFGGGGGRDDDSVVSYNSIASGTGISEGLRSRSRNTPEASTTSFTMAMQAHQQQQQQQQQSQQQPPPSPPPASAATSATAETANSMMSMTIIEEFDGAGVDLAPVPEQDELDSDLGMEYDEEQDVFIANLEDPETKYSNYVKAKPFGEHKDSFAYDAAQKAQQAAGDPDAPEGYFSSSHFFFALAWGVVMAVIIIIAVRVSRGGGGDDDPTPAPIMVPSMAPSVPMVPTTAAPVNASAPTTAATPAAPTGPIAIVGTLANAGNNGEPLEAFPLQVCQGDCDDDSSCAEGLICLLRETNDPPPAMCDGTPYADTDYCIPAVDGPPAEEEEEEEEQDDASVEILGTLDMAGNNGEPAEAYPLQICKGDCDDDTDCAEGLVCLQRANSDPAPDYCDGTPFADTDYCILATEEDEDVVEPPPLETDPPAEEEGEEEPAESEILGTLENAGNNGEPPEAYPLQICKGDCDDDTDCAEGLVCLERATNDPAPEGCDGEPFADTDYCIPGPGYIAPETEDPPADEEQVDATDPPEDETDTTDPPAVEEDGDEATQIPQEELDLVGNNGEPPEQFPLQVCEGDCDEDSECDVGLVCGQRDTDEPVSIFCSGEPAGEFDYCVPMVLGDNEDVEASAVPNTTAPTTSEPVPEEEDDATTTDPPATTEAPTTSPPEETDPPTPPTDAPTAVADETDPPEDEVDTTDPPEEEVVEPTDPPVGISTPSPTQAATPEADPTEPPTAAPSASPTEAPTTAPEVTDAPTGSPTETTTTEAPTSAPVPDPTEPPTVAPTTAPVPDPTDPPTVAPTTAPVPDPTDPPTGAPTTAPVPDPTEPPTGAPTTAPVPDPTEPPTEAPTAAPVPDPTEPPTTAPTEAPTTAPEPAPTDPPTVSPTAAPVVEETDPPEDETEPTDPPADEVEVMRGTIEFIGNNGVPEAVFPLAVCKGDCDDDAECAEGLICRDRDVGDPVSVVCDGEPDGSTDYCVPEVEPEAPPTQILGTIEFAGGNGEPPEAFPLQVCQGDCDDDTECGEGLACLDREADTDPVSDVCEGTPSGTTDYCVPENEVARRRR